jgi:hypothetical protein
MASERSGLRRAVGLAAGTFAVSVFVHFLWEMLQTFAYEVGPLGVNWVIAYHFLATLEDAGLMVALYAAGWAIHRDSQWIARLAWKDWVWLGGIGAALAVAIEAWALARGRWAYTPWMPVIPGLRVGLLPVLQLALLPPFILRVAARLFCVPAGTRRGLPADDSGLSATSVSPAAPNRGKGAGRTDAQRTDSPRTAAPHTDIQSTAIQWTTTHSTSGAMP